MSRRKRLHRIEDPEHLRFLTCSCLHRLALFQNDAIKDAFADHLTLTQRRLGFALIAWVIMPEHIHLLLLPHNQTVPEILSALKRPFATRTLARWRELRAPILPRLVDSEGTSRFWLPGGGYDHNVFTVDEMEEKTGYIHRNPVERGLVAKPTDWTWSSARFYASMEYVGPEVRHLAMLRKAPGGFFVPDD